MAKYKCPNLGECDHANRNEIFERAPGEELKCPSCGRLLDPLTASVPDFDSPKALRIVIGIVVLVAIAGGGYYLLGSTPAPVFTSGIAPSSSETKSLGQQSQDRLTSGDADGAEVAASKAAANEMIKLAIAKITQGKLDEAEKDLREARVRDPKQSLVPYNLAILRLKQGRYDDALKEFEASFVAGFSYFDKMDQDPDLNAVRKDSRFTNLVAQYRNKSVK